MLRRRFAIGFSGILWIVCGVVLFSRGVHCLADASQALLTHMSLQCPLLAPASAYTGSVERGMTLLLCISVGLGLIKGRFILHRSAHWVIGHICALPPSFSLRNVYPGSYYFLLFFMVGLGYFLKFTSLPLDVKGVLDSIVGAALINGAMLYLRVAFTLRNLKQSRAWSQLDGE